MRRISQNPCYELGFVFWLGDSNHVLDMVVAKHVQNGSHDSMNLPYVVCSSQAVQAASDIVVPQARIPLEMSPVQAEEGPGCDLAIFEGSIMAKYHGPL